MAFWWCLQHKTVEEHLGCGSTSRLGPYATPELAAKALERVGKREEEQKKKDEEIKKFWGKE